MVSKHFPICKQLNLKKKIIAIELCKSGPYPSTLRDAEEEEEKEFIAVAKGRCGWDYHPYTQNYNKNFVGYE